MISLKLLSIVCVLSRHMSNARTADGALTITTTEPNDMADIDEDMKNERLLRQEYDEPKITTFRCYECLGCSNTDTLTNHPDTCETAIGCFRYKLTYNRVKGKNRKETMMAKDKANFGCIESDTEFTCENKTECYDCMEELCNGLNFFEKSVKMLRHANTKINSENKVEEIIPGFVDPFRRRRKAKNAVHLQSSSVTFKLGWILFAPVLLVNKI